MFEAQNPKWGQRDTSPRIFQAAFGTWPYCQTSACACVGPWVPNPTPAENNRLTFEPSDRQPPDQIQSHFLTKLLSLLFRILRLEQLPKRNKKTRCSQDPGTWCWTKAAVMRLPSSMWTLSVNSSTSLNWKLMTPVITHCTLTVRTRSSTHLQSWEDQEHGVGFQTLAPLLNIRGNHIPKNKNNKNHKPTFSFENVLLGKKNK